MYKMLQHTHSGLRWLVLAFILIAIGSAISQWTRHSQDGTQLRWANIAVRITHLQLLVGAIIYFVSPKVQFAATTMKDAQLRFYTVEHLAMMLIAVILITVGYSKAKRKTATSQKARTVFWYFAIALLLILVSIPWPFREALGGSWF